MCTQAMTNQQLRRLYEKLTWQNSREIVFYTVLVQIIIVLLLTQMTMTSSMYGHENMTLQFDHYELNLPLLFAYISAGWFGKHLHKQRLTPFHFPTSIMKSGQYVVSATYGGLLAAALLLERYVFGIIAELSNDYQWHLPMTNGWVDFLFVLASLYIAIITGMLYSVKPLLTIFLGVISFAWLIVSTQLFYKEKMIDWLQTLHWSVTQYDALYLIVVYGPMAIVVIVAALRFVRKEEA